MNTYIVPAVVREHPTGGKYLTARVDPGMSWAGKPINGDRYLIVSPQDMPDLPPGRGRGERVKLSAKQMRDTARDNGINADDVEQRWSIGGS